jgi:hypothetical protein
MSRKRRAGDFVSPRPDVFTPPFGAPPPMPPPARLPGATDERLARLEKLHESGAVTDVEFLASDSGSWAGSSAPHAPEGH